VGEDSGGGDRAKTSTPIPTFPIIRGKEMRTGRFNTAGKSFKVGGNHIKSYGLKEKG
jgi:hypothetical protein